MQNYCWLVWYGTCIQIDFGAWAGSNPGMKIFSDQGLFYKRRHLPDLPIVFTR
jgi:hypothetical protein